MINLEDVEDSTLTFGGAGGGDEMVEWYHRLVGHEFEQAPGVGDGQGSLACRSPWGRRVGHKWATELITGH